MGYKEEISDILAEKAYEAKDSAGHYKFAVGSVLKFNYEGSITSMRITKIDRKNKKAWAEHTTLVDVDTGMSHYGHEVDLTQDPVFCVDCQVSVTERANTKGESRYQMRKEKDARTAKQKAKSSKAPGRAKKSPEGGPSSPPSQL